MPLMMRAEMQQQFAESNSNAIRNRVLSIYASPRAARAKYTKGGLHKAVTSPINKYRQERLGAVVPVQLQQRFSAEKGDEFDDVHLSEKKERQPNRGSVQRAVQKMDTRNSGLSPFGFFMCETVKMLVPEQKEDVDCLKFRVMQGLQSGVRDDITVYASVNLTRANLSEDSRNAKVALRYGDFGRRMTAYAEVLASYIIRNAESFAGKTVIELGAGLGISGLFAGCGTAAAEVVLSDGDPVVLDRLHFNVELNQRQGSLGSTDVNVQFLAWEDNRPFDGKKFDIVIASDCIYDYDMHSRFLSAVRKLLKPSGHAVIVAPPRQGSLKAFVNMARHQMLISSPDSELQQHIATVFNRMKCRPSLFMMRPLQSKKPKRASL